MNENELIARITARVLQEVVSQQAAQSFDHPGLVSVGVSARHVHLTQAHVETLFGKGHTLTPKKELMGGQFAAEEMVTLVGVKLRAIENVRVLGPVRSQSQVEVSATDAIKLGVNPPVRDSGKLSGSSPIGIFGPKGAVYLDEGCIVAKRHIHMPPVEAAAHGLRDGEVVSVRFDTRRAGVLNDVLVRVHESFTTEMHLDTDEANGLGIQNGDKGQIIREGLQ